MDIKVMHTITYQNSSVIQLDLKVKLKKQVLYSSSHFFNHFLACCEIKLTVPYFSSQITLLYPILIYLLEQEAMSEHLYFAPCTPVLNSFDVPFTALCHFILMACVFSYTLPWSDRSPGCLTCKDKSQQTGCSQFSSFHQGYNSS